MNALQAARTVKGSLPFSIRHGEPMRFAVWPSNEDGKMQIVFPSKEDINYKDDRREFFRAYPYTVVTRIAYRKGTVSYTVKLSPNVKRHYGEYGHDALLEKMAQFVLQRI